MLSRRRGHGMIELMHIEELARRLGYAGANSAFRDWCASLKITPVPGRRGYYDPHLVRRRLDEAQGLHAAKLNGDAPLALVEQRRLRRDQR